MQMKCEMKGPKLCSLPPYAGFPHTNSYECLSSFPLAKLHYELKTFLNLFSENMNKKLYNISLPHLCNL